MFFGEYPLTIVKILTVDRVTKATLRSGGPRGFPYHPCVPRAFPRTAGGVGLQHRHSEICRIFERNSYQQKIFDDLLKYRVSHGFPAIRMCF